MKTIVLGALALSLLASTAFAKGSHAVRAYVKKDGTHVASTRATNPNKTQRDNFSSKGNVNPATGKEGTKEPKR
jgi:hypothetical protein